MNFFKKLFSKPLSTQLTVTSGNGFHLRPVARFVSVAKTYSSHITATFNGRSVSAKAVNALLSLGVDKGDSFTLHLQGKDAPVALDTLTQTFLTLMQDDKEVEKIVKSKHYYTGEYFQGDSIHTGIAIAPLYHYKAKENYTQNSVTFQGAVVDAVTTLTKRSKEHSQQGTADIYLAQKELLLQLSTQAKNIETFALLIEKEIEALKGGKLESKCVDYQDLLRLMKSNLGYSYTMELPKKPFILLADDLLPSDIAQLEKSAVLGVILKHSSPTSHTAILLRAAGIPSLILADDVDADNHEVILDTYAGVLVSNPNTQDLYNAKEAQASHKLQESRNQEKRFEPALTQNNTHINVYANVTDVASASIAKEEGAEGIGLLRTEFLFGEQQPTLVSQTQAYSDIFKLFDDVTVRTLDVGGDKALPYIVLPKEENPFLGVRGVRLFQTHPEILAEQLQAIFLAAQGKKIKIMFPMVSSVEEFNHAKAFALKVAQTHQIAIEKILFGIMIEVPSVLFLLKEFDQVVDFYSVGTNDLTQYLFAIERTHPTLVADALSPVVFSALEQIVNTVTKPVSICGELASNPQAIPQLVKLRFKTLSVTAKSIPQTKENIRNV